MEYLTLGLLAVIASETSYLAYKSIPKMKIEKQSLLIDTSILIDGRILSIARSGLISAPMIIPRSVVLELQYMADKADHDKRERAREGLDMIEQLKLIETVTITIVDDKDTGMGVDERLTELAREYDARLCTIDYNLNKSARAQGVVVVNINELAHALRIVHLPGETVSLKLVQTGQESRQAVGYLDDGTMVVVDDAKTLIGQEVEAEVTRVLQTAAGKMMFARLVSKKPTNDSKNRSQPSKTTGSQTRGEGRMVADSPNRSKSAKQISEQTRGAVEDRSRMDADSKQTSEQTPGDSVAADPSKSRQASAPKRRRVASQSAATSEPTVSDKAATTAPETQSQVEKRGSPPPRNRRNRRRTPEDSLVDLANE